MTDFELLIIGAGPAGSAAAILCAQRGLRVALLEQADFPRARPGETLQPGVEPLLRQLGIVDAVHAAGFLRHTGHWVRWAGPPQFSAFGHDASGPNRGFQIPREALDGLLLGRAIESGVQVLQPCRVFKVIGHAQRVCGVRTARGDLTASYLIDASGASSWLSRQLKRQWRSFSPRLIAHYGYARGANPEEAMPCGIEADPFGWYWTAKVSAGLYHWTRLDFDPAVHARRVGPQMFEHLAATAPPRGADVSWRLCQQATGDGFFIAGDAAFVLDPAASQGVFKALASGMMAAHAVLQVRSAPWRESSIQQHYQHWIAQWFHRDRQALQQLYRTHPCPPRGLIGQTGSA